MEVRKQVQGAVVVDNRQRRQISLTMVALDDLHGSVYEPDVLVDNLVAFETHVILIRPIFQDAFHLLNLLTHLSLSTIFINSSVVHFLFIKLIIIRDRLILLIKKK